MWTPFKNPKYESIWDHNANKLSYFSNSFKASFWQRVENSLHLSHFYEIKTAKRECRKEGCRERKRESEREWVLMKSLYFGSSANVA